MGQREVYKILKTSKRWLISKEIIDRLEDSIGVRNLSRNLLKLVQSGMIKRKHIERNTFMYKII